MNKRRLSIIIPTLMIAFPLYLFHPVVAMANTLPETEPGVVSAADAQNTQGTQDMQGAQNMQGTQDAQNTQSTQGTQTTQSNQNMQGAQNTQNTQGTQDTQSTQNTQGTQDAQNTQNMQGTQDTQNTQNAQDIQNTQNTQNAQDTQDLENIQNTQDTQTIQDMQALQDAEIAPDTDAGVDAGVKTGTAAKRGAIRLNAAEPEEDPESAAEADVISDGAQFLSWLGAHQSTGGRAMLADDIVLEADYYSYLFISGNNGSGIYVDVNGHTITTRGSIEFLSDNGIAFGGAAADRGILRVADGLLSLNGISVTCSQSADASPYALWQEEGAGLVVDSCQVTGEIHYADTPFVLYENTVCVVVSRGQTAQELLPSEIKCMVNAGGSCQKQNMAVTWDLTGSERQQERRVRFQVRGTFADASAECQPVCTVVYDNYPLTFTDVKAAASPSTYTFRGGYTKPEEELPIKVAIEYSFDRRNWVVYDESVVSKADAGFFIGLGADMWDTEANPYIYLRLRWDQDTTQRYSNMLRYAADNLDVAEDIGGSRGGGVSLIPPTVKPEPNGENPSQGEVTPSGEQPTPSGEPTGTDNRTNHTTTDSHSDSNNRSDNNPNNSNHSNGNNGSNNHTNSSGNSDNGNGTNSSGNSDSSNRTNSSGNSDSSNGTNSNGNNGSSNHTNSSGNSDNGNGTNNSGNSDSSNRTNSSGNSDSSNRINSNGNSNSSNDNSSNRSSNDPNDNGKRNASENVASNAGQDDGQNGGQNVRQSSIRGETAYNNDSLTHHDALTQYQEPRKGRAIAVFSVFVSISAIAGAVGYCAHSGILRQLIRAVKVRIK